MAGRKVSLVLAGAVCALGCRAAPEESAPAVGTGQRRCGASDAVRRGARAYR